MYPPKQPPPQLLEVLEAFGRGACFGAGRDGRVDADHAARDLRQQRQGEAPEGCAGTGAAGRVVDDLTTASGVVCFGLGRLDVLFHKGIWVVYFGLTGVWVFFCFGLIWWVKSQIVPPVNIPIPTTIPTKMGGAPKTPK